MKSTWSKIIFPIVLAVCITYAAIFFGDPKLLWWLVAPMICYMG